MSNLESQFRVQFWPGFHLQTIGGPCPFETQCEQIDKEQPTVFCYTITSCQTAFPSQAEDILVCALPKTSKNHSPVHPGHGAGPSGILSYIIHSTIKNTLLHANQPVDFGSQKTYASECWMGLTQHTLDPQYAQQITATIRSMRKGCSI